LTDNALQTIRKYYRVDRKEIFFLRFIFEAYDGIAVLTTIDPGLGIVALCIAPDCEEEVEMVLQDLKKDIMINGYPEVRIQEPEA
jgi:hypothetical protein